MQLQAKYFSKLKLSLEKLVELQVRCLPSAEDDLLNALDDEEDGGGAGATKEGVYSEAKQTRAEKKLLLEVFDKIVEGSSSLPESEPATPANPGNPGQVAAEDDLSSLLPQIVRVSANRHKKNEKRRKAQAQAKQEKSRRAGASRGSIHFGLAAILGAKKQGRDERFLGFKPEGFFRFDLSLYEAAVKTNKIMLRVWVMVFIMAIVVYGAVLAIKFPMTEVEGVDGAGTMSSSDAYSDFSGFGNFTSHVCEVPTCSKASDIAAAAEQSNPELFCVQTCSLSWTEALDNLNTSNSTAAV